MIVTVRSSSTPASTLCMASLCNLAAAFFFLACFRKSVRAERCPCTPKSPSLDTIRHAGETARLGWQVNHVMMPKPPTSTTIQPFASTVIKYDGEGRDSSLTGHPLAAEGKDGSPFVRDPLLVAQEFQPRRWSELRPSCASCLRCIWFLASRLEER